MSNTSLPHFNVRLAEASDAGLILEFIKGLAEYEKMLDQVVATEEQLRHNLFELKQAEVIIGEDNGKPVAFALFFHNFSTFLGKANLYLEDLFVLPEARGKGFGKIMLAYLGKIALERNCGRLDWWCLDWNTSSIEFYLQLGAKPMDEWTTYRVEGEALSSLASKV